MPIMELFWLFERIIRTLQRTHQSVFSIHLYQPIVISRLLESTDFELTGSITFYTNYLTIYLL